MLRGKCNSLEGYPDQFLYSAGKDLLCPGNADRGGNRTENLCPVPKGKGSRMCLQRCRKLCLESQCSLVTVAKTRICCLRTKCPVGAQQQHNRQQVYQYPLPAAFHISSAVNRYCLQFGVLLFFGLFRSLDFPNGCLFCCFSQFIVFGEHPLKADISIT